MPKTSVIVPCFNQAQYLDECLESVLNQSFQEWECIIINDGSTDNTIEVASTWEKEDSRFKLITIENAGVSNARNIGIKNSNSKFIMPLDADDRLAPLYLEKAFEEINLNKYSVVYCNAQYFGKKTGLMPVSFKSLKNLLLKNEIFVSALFKKRDFFSIGGFDENMDKGYEDWEFWINLLSKKNGGVIQLDYIGFFYRIKKNSRNQNVMKDKIIKTEMTNYIYKKHSNCYQHYHGNPIDNIKKLNDFKDLQKVSSLYSFNDLIIVLLSKFKKKLKFSKI